MDSEASFAVTTNCAITICNAVSLELEIEQKTPQKNNTISLKSALTISEFDVHSSPTFQISAINATVKSSAAIRYRYQS
jgi:hypothetical protein